MIADVRAADAAAAAAPRAFRPQVGLRWLLGFGASGVALSTLYATTGVGFGCPFRSLTGWECPFCGGTRLGSALLHGDLVAAFAFNPVVLLGLVALTVLGGLWIVEAAGGPAVRPPRRIRSITLNQWLLVGGVVAVVFTVLRNVL